MAIPPGLMAVLLGAPILLVMGVFLAVYASRFRKVAPNQVLVVSGMRRQVRGSKGEIQTIGYRVVRGGGTFVWPVLERCDVLSLEVIAVDIETPAIATTEGGSVIIAATAQVKIGSDEGSLAKAIEQLMTRTPVEIAELARTALLGHFGAVAARLSRDDIERDRSGIGEKARGNAESDLSRFGLQLVTLAVKAVRSA